MHSHLLSRFWTYALYQKEVNTQNIFGPNITLDQLQATRRIASSTKTSSYIEGFTWDSAISPFIDGAGFPLSWKN